MAPITLTASEWCTRSAEPFHQALNSLADVARQDPASPSPEGVAVGLVLLLQWRKRNALLSVLAGTFVYVLLRNVAAD